MDQESPKTFIAAANMAVHTRVVVNASGQAALAGAAPSVGTLVRPAVTGAPVAVKLWGETREVIASAAIAIGDRVTFAASGKVVGNASGPLVALTAAGADGNILEVAPVI